MRGLKDFIYSVYSKSSFRDAGSQCVQGKNRGDTDELLGEKVLAINSSKWKLEKLKEVIK